MKKILLDSDIVIIDGEEYTTQEIKTALIKEYQFDKLTDSIQAKGGVASDH